jgi:dipeptidase D
MKSLAYLYPQPLWSYFSEILKIPRPSKKEEQIIGYLLRFAARHNLPAKKDKAGNILISKPAYKGKEKVPVIVLQTHMDIVCEKNSEKKFDFLTDPIEAIVSDEWVSADGTTLGADDGIGIAAQLAVLASQDIQHGPLECLFTVDEETGLTGAIELQPGFFSGKILVNLDSEDEGELFIGCAGGIDTVAVFHCQKLPVPDGSVSIELKVTGLQGGHSGDNIHQGLGNANKILVRFLWLASSKYKLALAGFDGGNLRNAIAREACAVLRVPQSDVMELISDFEQFASIIRYEFEKTEPGLILSSSLSDNNSGVIDEFTFSGLIYALMACPHGVLEWSTRMAGMVETSTNLASVKFIDKDKIEVTTSQRSEIESRKMMAAGMVESVFKLAGAEVIHSDGYPGWSPDPSSAILKLAVKSYRRLFSAEPIVRSIHAGLECGLFSEKYPGLDMVSIGPTIKGAHSPGERINIETVGKFWKHLVDVLEHMPSA